MTTPALKAAAKAICRANCSSGMEPEAIECQVDSGWDMWLPEAQAAIDAWLSASLPSDIEGLVERLTVIARNLSVNYQMGGIVIRDAAEEAADTISRLSLELEEARSKLERIVQGDVPRPIGERWRADGKVSKLDRCIHDVGISDDCSNCIVEFISPSPPKEG